MRKRATERSRLRALGTSAGVLLLALLAVLLALSACNEDDNTSSTATVTSGGGSGSGQATSWGPLTLVQGSLEELVVRGNVAVGRIACDVGHDTEHTYLYALDLETGTLTGSAEIPKRCHEVDIGTRYVFAWAADGIRIYDLTQGLAYVQTWDDQFVSDFGRYFYVEDRSGPDYLIDQETLAPVTAAQAFGSERATDDYIYDLLYPDCVIGDPYAFENQEGDRAVVYSLAEHTVVGRLPRDLQTNDIVAWDPEQLLVFAVVNTGVASERDKLVAYSLSKDKVVAESEIVEGDSVGEHLRKGGSGAYGGSGDRLDVIADVRPASDGSYVVNGTKRWYVLSPSGKVERVLQGAEAVGEHEGDVLAYDSAEQALGAHTLDGEARWSNQVPGFFGTHPDGPYLTSGSIAWVSSCSGRKGHGDLLSQWSYGDGSNLAYTEFTGYEIQVLCADPFVLALRERRPGDDGPWMVGGGDATQLPLNILPDIRISYSPRDIHARSTEVGFTCQVEGLPDSLADGLTCEWDLGGVKATGSELTHVFPTAGTFTVTVTVTVGGSVGSATKSIEVEVDDPLVPADFQPEVRPDYFTAAGLTFSFACRGLSREVTRVEWDFGDGATGAGINCSHNYQLGDYEATCRLYDAGGTLLYEKTVDIRSGYPFFDIDVTPRDGPASLRVRGSCALDGSGQTDDGLRYAWYVSDAGDGETQPVRTLVSQSASFTEVLTESGTYVFSIEVTDPAGGLATSQSFTVVVAPMTLTVGDEGRTIHSDLSMFVANSLRGDPLYDPDHDGLNQRWENLAMETVNPTFELDEGEDWLLNQNIHKVANFVRVSTWPEFANPDGVRYVVFYFGVAWSKDYGRYMDIPLTQAHNGDVEKVVLVFRVLDEQTLDLVWVFTSAHSTNRHDGVWAAREESTNTGTICNLKNDVWGTEQMVASLEFVDSTVKLYTSEDKHANYPSEEVGESVRLVWLGASPQAIFETWLLEQLDATELSTSFVQEDVGGGPLKRWACYNVGEPDAHLMDNISFLFKNERVWTGNANAPGRFAGGLVPQPAADLWPGSPGTIGGRLAMPDVLIPLLAD